MVDSLWKIITADPYIQLSLGLQETLAVLAINQEDNAVDLSKVILPDAAGYLRARNKKVV